MKSEQSPCHAAAAVRTFLPPQRALVLALALCRVLALLGRPTPRDLADGQRPVLRRTDDTVEHALY